MPKVNCIADAPSADVYDPRRVETKTQPGNASQTPTLATL